jgi:translocation and assembly module TamB
MIRITGQRAELVQSAVATAVLTLDVALAGRLARDPRVSGRVDVVSLDVTIPERLPATLKPLPGTKHLHPTPTTTARLALDAKARRAGRAAPAFDPALDLTIAAPGHILVHGRGLDAELGGSLRLTGTLAKPTPVGAFSLRRGRLRVLTARLEFTRGNLTFAGDFRPELDFLATTQAGGATVGVAITGQASDPQFAFTSSPELPEDEVLSRLLFGTPSGQLTTGQALALAQAAAQYSGGGDGAFERLRRSLGLGGLDVNLGASGGPSVGLERALNNRISVGVKAGPSAAQTGVGVDIRVTDKVKVQGEVGANGAASVGVGVEHEW